MESHVLLAWLIHVSVLLSDPSVRGSNFEIGRSRSPGLLKENSTINVVKPEFVAQPKNKYVLPNSPAAHLLCEARFVSKLNINCTGGLVPREIYYNQSRNHATLLIVEILPVLIKNYASGIVCTCVATGYNGLVIRSHPAAVRKAFLDENFIISPSVDTRVPKNSIVILKCQPPTGLPRPRVSWWKDGHPVDKNMDRRVLVKTRANFSLFIIRKAKLSHEGNYSCVASNLAGKRESGIIKLTVYVDGGWTEWRQHSPCTALKCGSGTKMLKRFCSNPTPENGGQFCVGPDIKREPCRDICPVDGGWSEWREFAPCSAPKCGIGKKMLQRFCSNPSPENGGQFCVGLRIKTEACQDICPEIEITCPDPIDLYINQSDVTSVNVSWNKPLVRTARNGTKFSVKVIPQWAKPPILLNIKYAEHVIEYFARDEYGQTANCSFKVTVYNVSSHACLTKDCSADREASTISPFSEAYDKLVKTKSGVYILASSVAFALLLVFVLNFVYRRRKMRSTPTIGATKQHEGSKDNMDLNIQFVTRSVFYGEPGAVSEKLTAASPTGSEAFEFHNDFQGAIEFSATLRKEPDKTMHVEAEITNDQQGEKGHNFKRTISSVSNKSTASEISRMIWNISDIPENADPNMVAWGLVDHNGGKLTIGNTGVSLTVPPDAIPEGRTEGIYIAIMDQEKEHPRITAKGSLLSPVVKCGPSGLKFQRPVILSMPHCALLEEGAWNLKVQYNESEPSTAADWKQLIDVNKQDGTEESHVVVEHNMVHLMVDHFTIFAVTGESAANRQAERTLQILAYVTPPEANSDCAVRVYCVGGTPAAVEDVHNQETKKYRGETIEGPKQLHFKDGGGDLLVKLTNRKPGWNTSATRKEIRFRDIWEGIERMPSCTFVFSRSDTSVFGFHAAFEVRQDCENGDEKEVNVVTFVRRGSSENPGPSNEDNKQSNSSLSCTCKAAARLPPAASLPCLMDHSTALLNAGSIGNPWQYQQPEIPAGAYGGSPATSPVTVKQMSSGYFSVGFESLPSMDLPSRELRSKLAVILDPPHESDWKVLAVHVGLSNKDIRWIDSRKAHSPTEILFNFLETTDGLRNCFPLRKLAEILEKMDRDDAVQLINSQLSMRKETVV